MEKFTQKRKKLVSKSFANSVIITDATELKCLKDKKRHLVQMTKAFNCIVSTDAMGVAKK